MKKFYTALKALKEIYPPYLVLLVITPIITGFIIDHELSDSRHIIINLIWIPLFTIPFILVQKRIIYQLATLIYFLIGLIEIGHWIILKGPVTLTSLLVMSNTNYLEAIEFLDLKATTGLLILIPYTFLFFFSFRHSPKYFQSKIKPYIIGAVLLVSAIFIFENAIHERFIRKGVPQIVKVSFSFIDKINLYREAMQEIDPRILNANSTFIASRQTFVLILGESCSRQHMSLYGASRNTNPKLERRNDLIIYDNVVSPYSNTLNSVLSMFSQSNIERKISFENSIDIIDVFYSAGFKTYWISNQSPIGIWDNLVTVFAKKSDYFKFVNTTSNSSFEAILTTSYDSKLFKPFISALKEDVSKKFIVLHLMGSHSSYSKRYPSDFDIFNGSNNREETIAEYDNSMLYNDFIIDSLLNIIITNDSPQNSSIISAIYLSDHGENVYDELDRVGHDYSKELPNANVEVPFIVWLSPGYLNLNPEKVKVINSNRNKPFVSDDLFHSIMDLNGIQSSYLEEERSIFSEKFNEARQRILEDGKDYDKK
ncbi:MAG: phosphoethanolamine transferase [Bacteroidales bacterium]|nr:phosphoethanolamine transferase [Bacteroidales bacterium]